MARTRRPPRTIEQAPVQKSLPESPSPAEQPLALVEEDAPSPQPTTAVARREAKNPMEILLEAIQDPTLDLNRLSTLMELQKRWADEQARKAFVRAMMEFKRNPPEIRRNRVAEVVGRNGGAGYSYEYADLPTVLQAAVPALARVGITHSWDMKIDREHKWISVTCILTHEDGYSIKVEGGGPFDEGGGKNPTQAIASANSYWQRYTFNAACGLSSSRDEDDDGKYAGDPGLAPISAEQLAEIRGLVKQATDLAGMDEKRFLDFMRAPSLEEIPVQAYELAIHSLKTRLNK